MIKKNKTSKSSKKNIIALISKDKKSYFAPRKSSSGTVKNGLSLRKFSPTLRQHVLAEGVVKSKRISSK